MFLRPRLQRIDNANRVTLVKDGSMLSQLVTLIPRQDCQFRRITMNGEGLTGIKALRMQLSRETLMQDQVFHIEQAEGSKQAYVWSYAESFTDHGRCLPESLAQKPLKEGTRLVDCQQGFEGQIWENSQIVATRWWLQMPHEHDWEIFLKAAPIDVPYMALPKPTSIGYRDDLPRFVYSQRQAEKDFAPLNVLKYVGLLTVCATVFLLAQETRYLLQLRSYSAQISQVEQEAQQVLSDRRRALSNISFPLELRELGDPEQLSTALYGIAYKLSQSNLLLNSVALNDGRLVLNLSGEPTQNGPEIVKSLQELPVLRAVNVTFVNEERLTIEADLVPYQAIETEKLVAGTEPE